MASLNKVLIIGNLGRDPEVRFTPTGKPVATMSIAATEKWKDNGGQQQERTEWIRVVAFDRLAEVVQEYVKKGSPVYVEGKLVTQSWEDKSGVTRYSTVVYARSLQMLGGKRDNMPEPPKSDGNDMPPQTFDSTHDDIPF